jgi:hypothetical protein
MDGAYFLYVSLSFCVHEDFGLSCFSLLIDDVYSQGRSIPYGKVWHLPYLNFSAALPPKSSHVMNAMKRSQSVALKWSKEEEQNV